LSEAIWLSAESGGIGRNDERHALRAPPPHTRQDPPNRRFFIPYI